MDNVILLRYAELFLKGKNKKFLDWMRKMREIFQNRQFRDLVSRFCVFLPAIKKMSKFGLHNQHVEIPLQGMEFVRFSICGGLWSLRTVNLFMPPLNKLCLDSIPQQGNLSKSRYNIVTN